jgi:hypothetical protein
MSNLQSAFIDSQHFEETDCFCNIIGDCEETCLVSDCREQKLVTEHDKSNKQVNNQCVFH